MRVRFNICNFYCCANYSKFCLYKNYLHDVPFNRRNVLFLIHYLVANGLIDDEPVVVQKLNNDIHRYISSPSPPDQEPDLTPIQVETIITKQTEPAFVSSHEQSTAELTPLHVQSPLAAEPYLPLLQNESPPINELPSLSADEFHDSERPEWGVAGGMFYSLFHARSYKNVSKSLLKFLTSYRKTNHKKY